VSALSWLSDAARRVDDAGLRRTLVPRAADEDVVDLAGNDYLGLARHPQVIAAAVQAARTWGTGSTGSRLVTGTTALHAELDEALAAFVGTEAGIVLGSGYAANLAAVTVLAGRGSLIVSDASNHASLVDACRLSGARIAITPHSDVDAVQRALADRAEQRALVVSDGVFSADGDAADIAALQQVCSDQSAMLLVDDAHALGVLGPQGQGSTVGVPRDELIVTVTLSKALGAQGGAVLGPRAVIDHLISTGRAFIFDTGLAPPAAAAALAALRLLEADPDLPQRVLGRAADVARLAGDAGWELAQPQGPVVSLVLGDPAAAVAAARRCLEHGVRVGCFRPPSVPAGTSRLRIVARADLTDADLDRVAVALKAARP
jgi:8-amino-7-oxononanoate synthase